MRYTAFLIYAVECHVWYDADIWCYAWLWYFDMKGSEKIFYDLKHFEKLQITVCSSSLYSLDFLKPIILSFLTLEVNGWDMTWAQWLFQLVSKDCTILLSCVLSGGAKHFDSLLIYFLYFLILSAANCCFIKKWESHVTGGRFRVGTADL